MPRLNVIFFNYTFFASALTSNVMQTHTQRVTRVALASAFCGMFVVWYVGALASVQKIQLALNSQSFLQMKILWLNKNNNNTKILAKIAHNLICLKIFFARNGSFMHFTRSFDGFECNTQTQTHIISSKRHFYIEMCKKKSECNAIIITQKISKIFHENGKFLPKMSNCQVKFHWKMSKCNWTCLCFI